MFSERPWPTQNEVLEYFGLTIPDMIYNGNPITFSSVAHRCSLSLSYYRHPETRSAIKYYKPSGMSKAELQKEVTQLRDRVLTLELKFNERHYIRPFFPQSDEDAAQTGQADQDKSSAAMEK